MVVSIERSTADFIQHMFAASESAINILNDLLQYEHMEAGCRSQIRNFPALNTVFHAGNLNLEPTWVPLARALENRFGWAMILADQSDISFEIRDETSATEFGTAMREDGSLSILLTILVDK